MASGILSMAQQQVDVGIASNTACVRSSTGNATSKDFVCCNLASSRAHVVASHCKEDLQALDKNLRSIFSVTAMSQLQPCLFVYSKCGQAQQVQNALLSTVQVVELDNAAREGHTYLTHVYTS